MSAFVIVNPRSGGGKALRAWRTLEPALATIYPYMSVAFTRRRGEATSLAAAALREGHSEIVAVGGEGTVNETVNGFFDADGAVSPDAVLAFVSSGEFGETVRRDVVTAETIEHLKRSHVRPVDVGRVQFLSRDGIPRTRYFADIASFGLSGLIASKVNHSVLTAMFGRKFAFKWHAALGALGYGGRAVRLITDSGFDEIVDIAAVAVANGRVFGAGLEMVPDAKPDDGQFDIAIIANGPKLKTLGDIRRLYTGEPSINGNVQVVRGRRIVAAPVADTRGRSVLIETDGESVGRLPATFEILPRALNVRY